MTLRHDDVSKCAWPLMRRINNLTCACQWAHTYEKVSKNTLHVTYVFNSLQMAFKLVKEIMPCVYYLHVTRQTYGDLQVILGSPRVTYYTGYMFDFNVNYSYLYLFKIKYIVL